VSAVRRAPSIFNTHDIQHVTSPSLDDIRNLVQEIFDRRRLTTQIGVVALVLLERTRIKLNSSNWSRLVMLALLLANKEAEDVYNVWNSKFLGIIPDVPVYEINLLEREFLQYLKYRLHVELPTYIQYHNRLLLECSVEEQQDSEELSRQLVDVVKEEILPILPQSEELDQTEDLTEIPEEFVEVESVKKLSVNTVKEVQPVLLSLEEEIEELMWLDTIP